MAVFGASAFGFGVTVDTQNKNKENNAQDNTQASINATTAAAQQATATAAINAQHDIAEKKIEAFKAVGLILVVIAAAVTGFKMFW